MILLSNRDYYKLLDLKTSSSSSITLDYGLQLVCTKDINVYRPDEGIRYGFEVVDEHLFFLAVIKYGLQYIREESPKEPTPLYRLLSSTEKQPTAHKP